MRQRRIDIQSFLRGENLFFRRHVIEGAHVVHPVGELDENHPDVFAHRQQHLAEILRLLFFAAAEIGPAQFRDAVDESGNLFAEQAFELFQRCQGIFDGVVQQPADDAGHVELQVGDDAGHRQSDESDKALPTAVFGPDDFGGKFVGFADQLDIRGGIISLDLFNQIGNFDVLAHDFATTPLAQRLDPPLADP